MDNYTVGVKFNTGEVYNFTSNRLYMIGRKVHVKNTNGSFGYGEVVYCNLSDEIFEGIVVNKGEVGKGNPYPSYRKLENYVHNITYNQKFDITTEVYEWYISNTVFNSKLSFEEVKLKLNRNVILAGKMKSICKGRFVNAIYGNIKLKIDLKTDTIVMLSRIPKSGEKDWYSVSKEKKLKLNEKFGIEGNVYE